MPTTSMTAESSRARPTIPVPVTLRLFWRLPIITELLPTWSLQLRRERTIQLDSLFPKTFASNFCGGWGSARFTPGCIPQQPNSSEGGGYNRDLVTPCGRLDIGIGKAVTFRWLPHTAASNLEGHNQGTAAPPDPPPLRG